MQFEVSFFCTVKDISATVTPIVVKLCMMVHIGLHIFFSPFGPQGIPKIPNSGPQFWQFNHEYLENGKSQLYMSIRATVG